MSRFLATLALALACVPSPAYAARAGDVQIRPFPPGVPAAFAPPPENAEYSNISTYQAYYSVQDPIAADGPELRSRVLMDDLTPLGVHRGADVVRITFSLASINPKAVEARVLLRFWHDEAGSPGAYYDHPADVGFDLGMRTIPPGASLVVWEVPPGTFAMPETTFWAGVGFDNGTPDHYSAISLQEMSGLGQVIYGPPDIGSSSSASAITSTAQPEAFLGVDRPQVAWIKPPAVQVNYGWEFVTAPVTPTASATWGAIKHRFR